MTSILAILRLTNGRSSAQSPLLVLGVVLSISAYSYSNLPDETQASVVITTPVGFRFVDVDLHVVDGDIVRPAYVTDINVMCRAGDNSECEQCCHGNGVCSSGSNKGCICQDNFDSDNSCATPTYFKIQNLWTSESKFIYHASHALWRQLATMQLNMLIHGMLQIDFNPDTRTIESISGVGGADPAGTWVMAKEIDGNLCLVEFSYIPNINDVMVLMYWSRSDVHHDFSACDTPTDMYISSLRNATRDKIRMEKDNDANLIRVDIEAEHDGSCRTYSSCLMHNDKGKISFDIRTQRLMCTILHLLLQFS